MSETHQQITQAVESYVKENEAFETKGIKACLLYTSPSPRD